MEHVPADFAADSGGMPDVSACLPVTAQIWLTDGVAEGYYYPSGNPVAKKPYCGLDGLLLGLEELMERQGRPRREKLRGIPGFCRKPYRPAYCPDGRPECTVSIRVYFRQHCSMQGELCLQGGQKVCFRSALELLCLLWQAVGQLSEKEEIERQRIRT